MLLKGWVMNGYGGAWIGLAWGLLWFVFWGVIVISRRKERLRLYDILEQAVREGRTIPPELLNPLTARSGTPQSSLRVGVILIALSLGMIAVGVVHYYSESGPNPRWFYGPFAMFPIPLFLGLAFLVIAWLRRNGRMDV